MDLYVLLPHPIAITQEGGAERAKKGRTHIKGNDNNLADYLSRKLLT
jgi:hypothetical protein